MDTSVISHVLPLFLFLFLFAFVQIILLVILLAHVYLLGFRVVEIDSTEYRV